MKRPVFAVLLASLPLLGCSKHADSASNQDSQPAAEQQTNSDGTAAVTVTPPTGAPIPMPASGKTVVQDSGDASANTTRLTKQLYHFIAKTHTIPNNFEDLVAKAHLQPPPPPPGKKYVITSEMKVALVNQ